MSAKKRLGEILIDSGLITAETCNRALRMQVGGTRRLGKILVKMGALTSDQLLETLATQFELPIVDIEQEYNPEAKGLLPRYLCSKYEVFPLGLEGRNHSPVSDGRPVGQRGGHRHRKLHGQGGATLPGTAR